MMMANALNFFEMFNSCIVLFILRLCYINIVSIVFVFLSFTNDPVVNFSHVAFNSIQHHPCRIHL
jgi:hypothetical protein